jgi:hemoglobin
MASLYERIGGESAVKATVMRLYGRILSDPSLAPFFDHIDINQLRKSQVAFVTYAFGGPNHYTGRGLRSAHRASSEQGMAESHFERVANHLVEVMRELDVNEALISESLAIIDSVKNDILQK